MLFTLLLSYHPFFLYASISEVCIRFQLEALSPLPPDWCYPHLKLCDVVAEGDVEGPVLGLLAQPGLVHLQCLVSCIVLYHYQY